MSQVAGPGSYTMTIYGLVHAKLGIDHEAFGVIGGLLRKAMENHGIANADVDAVMHETRA